MKILSRLSGLLGGLCLVTALVAGLLHEHPMHIAPYGFLQLSIAASLFSLVIMAHQKLYCDKSPKP